MGGAVAAMTKRSNNPSLRKKNGEETSNSVAKSELDLLGGNLHRKQMMLRNKLNILYLHNFRIKITLSEYITVNLFEIHSLLT